VNAEFIALAFVAALNPKLLAVDLLLIENRRPREAGPVAVSVAVHPRPAPSMEVHTGR